MEASVQVVKQPGERLTAGEAQSVIGIQVNKNTHLNPYAVQVLTHPASEGGVSVGGDRVVVK